VILREISKVFDPWSGSDTVYLVEYSYIVIQVRVAIPRASPLIEKGIEILCGKVFILKKSHKKIKTGLSYPECFVCYVKVVITI